MIINFFKKLFEQPVPDVVTHIPQYINIDIINESTVVTDAQVKELVDALQVQVDRDFGPIWGIGANLNAVAKGQTANPNNWWLCVLDSSDMSGALGYHDLTETGKPLGKSFAKDDLKYGLSWTVTVSHELLEMILDPYINDVIFAQTTDTAGTLFSKEVCDAVEDDSFGYMIGNVLVSDFQLPAWFESNRAPNSTQFSFKNNVHAPFALAKGGYIGAFDVTNGKGWTQITAEESPSYRATNSRRVAKRIKGMHNAQMSKLIK